MCAKLAVLEVRSMPVKLESMGLFACVGEGKEGQRLGCSDIHDLGSGGLRKSPCDPYSHQPTLAIPTDTLLTKSPVPQGNVPPSETQIQRLPPFYFAAFFPVDYPLLGLSRTLNPKSPIPKRALSKADQGFPLSFPSGQ